MTDRMSRRERVMAGVRGEMTDRPAWSLWRHFYDAEYTAEQLAERMVGWVQRYQFDFMKVNPRAQYHVEVFGARYGQSDQEHVRGERIDYPIKRAEDWEKLEPRGLDAPALTEQLAALRLIKAASRGELPFVETVFSPLGVAGYMVEDNQTLVRQIRENSAAVHHGLDVIARTFAPFASACLEAGADGVFFATTRWASRELLTPEEYAEFGRPYDLQVLDAVKGASFNVLHVCDAQNMLLDLTDYPVQAWNWAATDPTNPGLADTTTLPGLKIGGLSAEVLTSEAPSMAAHAVERARVEAGDRGWALGPNCSIPSTSRDENIRAAGRAIGVPV